MRTMTAAAPILHVAGGPCLAYVRVSTEDQARPDKTSIADQQRAVTALAERLGLTLGGADVFADEGRSGATAEGRPAFMALVAYCQRSPRPASRPGHVLVLNDSRWGRFGDPEEATYWRVVLKRCGWLVRFAEGDDVEDPLGRGVLRTIHSAQASAYREAVKANAKRGARGTAAQGFWQNEAPLGYRRQTVGGSRPGTALEVGQRKSDDEKVRLTPGPELERGLVAWMFERYATGTVSLGALARELAQRFPQRRWGRQTVRQVLRNRAYVGEVVWCRRPHDKAEAEQRRVRDRGEWVVVERAHPALVSLAVFDRVQRQLGENARELRSKAGGYPLSGLLRCATCGEPYIGAGGPVGPPSDPDRYRFYRCRGGERGICPGRLGTVQARHIEPLVVDLLAREFGRPRNQQMFTAWIDDTIARRSRPHNDRARGLTAERRDTERAIERLVQAIARGTLSEGEAAAELATQRQRLAALEAERQSKQQAAGQMEQLAATRERWLALVGDFRRLATGMRPALLRQMLRTLGVAGVVNKTSRRLDLTIPSVPEELAAEFGASSSRPGRASQRTKRPPVIRVRHVLPPAGPMRRRATQG